MLKCVRLQIIRQAYNWCQSSLGASTMASSYPGRNLDSIHLRQGDPKPPPQNYGSLRLYSMRYCPYAERAMLVLSAKDLRHDVVNINLKYKPEWFLSDVNPLGKVPAIGLDGGRVICDSLIVCEYIDDVHTQNKLLSNENFERAQQKFMLERLSTLQVSLHNFLVKRGTENTLEKVVAALTTCENLLEGDYYGGARPLWQDYMIWPWFERLGSGTLASSNVELRRTYPKLHRYVERMSQREEVARVLKSGAAHATFFQSFQNREPNYDHECSKL